MTRDEQIIDSVRQIKELWERVKVLEGRQYAITVQVPEMKPVINVTAAEQKPPVVNIGETIVNVPEGPAPVVNVTNEAPVVNVPQSRSPDVVVNVPQGLAPKVVVQVPEPKPFREVKRVRREEDGTVTCVTDREGMEDVSDE
jgi:hypothetical protein